MRRSLLVSLLAIGLAATACSSSKSTASTPGPATGGTGTPANCSDESQGSAFTLTQQDFAFHPSCVIAKSAQSISITNKDSVLHNFSITGTQVDQDIQPGTTFNGQSAGLAPGTYEFFCKYHKSSGMVGTIVVT
jgi:plastocyanin